MDKLVGFARKKRLGDLLVDAGVISQDQLVKALQVQKTEKQGERLGVVLIDLGFTDEKQIVEALKAQLKIQSVDLSTLRIPEEIIRLLDEAVRGPAPSGGGAPDPLADQGRYRRGQRRPDHPAHQVRRAGGRPVCRRALSPRSGQRGQHFRF